MTTATSTQGFQLTLEDESALGTAAANVSKEIRVNEVPTCPTNTRSAQAQSHLGHENVFTKDAPIAFEEFRADALSFPVQLRRGRTKDETPPLAYFLQSAGCTLTTFPTSNDTVLAWTDANTFTITTGDVTIADDKVSLPLFPLSDTTALYYPVLAMTYTDATEAVELAMDIPAADVSAAGKAIARSHNIYPPYGNQVSATKTLTFEYKTRGDHAGHGDADDLTFLYAGCALSNVGEIEIVPNGDVVWPLTFHVADVEDTFGDDLDTDAMLDSEKRAKCDDNFRFFKATASASGNIADATDALIKASINLGIDCQPIPGTGGTTTLNGIQGYMASCIDPSITVELLLTSAQLLAFESATTNQFLSFVQPVSALADVGWALFAPNCQLRESTTVDFSEKYHKMTAVYDMCAPTYGSTTANGDAGMAPWIFTIMQDSVT